MKKQEAQDELLIAGFTLQLALAAFRIIRGPNDSMSLDTTIHDIEKTLARPLMREVLDAWHPPAPAMKTPSYPQDRGGEDDNECSGRGR